MVDAGLPDTATMKRTGHRCVESIKGYQNLLGKTGRIQQNAILPSREMSKRDERNVDTCNNLNEVNSVHFDRDRQVTNRQHKRVRFANDALYMNATGDLENSVTSALQTIGVIHGGTVNISINLSGFSSVGVNECVSK